MRLRVAALIAAISMATAPVAARDAMAAPTPTSATSKVIRSTARAVPSAGRAQDLPAGGAEHQQSGAVQTASARVGGDVAGGAVTLPAGSDVEHIYMRSVRDGAPDAWSAVEVEAVEGAPTTVMGTVPVVVSAAEQVDVVVISEKPVVASLQVYSTAVTSTDSAVTDPPPVTPPPAPPVDPMAHRSPDIYSRAAWQADETLVKRAYETGVVTGAMIHHTAGKNDYAREDVPGILRAIQSYHVNGRGWNDIGYNLLVDRFGTAWEGRGGGVKSATPGGHALGVTNYRTTGISLIGDFGTTEPPAVMLTTLQRLIAWKFKLHGVDPAGRTWGSSGQDGGSPHLAAISGHRDENATDCPGERVVAKMPSIRTNVRRLMDTEFKDVKALPQVSRRLGGDDQFVTAARVSEAGFPMGASTVFIATARTFEDALAVGPWANQVGAPILLAGPSAYPTATRDELARLNPSRIILVGGPLSLNAQVEARIRADNPMSTVERVWGETAYMTAVGISENAFPAAPEVFLASSNRFPDGLVGGPLARGVSPILLTPGAGPLPASVMAEMTRLGTTRVTVLGGPLTVSESILTRLAEQGITVERISGPTLYDTAVEVAKRGFSGSVKTFYLATGKDYPDALVSVGLQTSTEGPLLLSPGSCLPASVIEYLKTKPGAKVVPIGGRGALPIDETLLPVCT